ncbi:hypothetical protein K432DRAFT_398895 [Lepidopterella palustris CBS 459.81]|uniref:NmrA-like domain-containing protein n=1 Tax=Lepidopterella palustris CBS 459.81 TaxID=1314670 RepID=A0A8E2DXF7_9PEZI|nr:hypothetical protein K432DRAFT_398895 [Lepidopterella palustris CBS 459.81]
MEAKGDANSSAGTSPVIVREEGIVPLPTGPNHKFALIALGDVALVVAHVLSGKGKHGFDDKHRGRLIVLTGEELARAARQALGIDMQFEDISEAEAKRVLHAQAPSDTSEIQYLLEYYALVREGKTNYISTCAFHDITGQHPQNPVDFFKVYASEFQPAHASKKRKTNGK